ncbi:MAG: metallophosphoesterase family protein, partial [Planctomycetota bacterium]|nr:metallophosphoesterase family protein [Planctomycetota bacterium]
MIRIGLLSDTHGYLDPLVWDYLDDRDEIWHAGDFGGADVVQQLQAAGKPLRGVFGNIDDEVVRAEFPEHLRFLC